MNSFNMDELIEKMREKEKIKREMVESEEYINWLIDFTDYFNEFCDIDWLYEESSLSKEDKDNIDNLSLFYEVVNKYALNNFLFPIRTKSSRIYQIIYNGIGFELEMFFGEEISYICRRVDVVNELDFINYQNIIDKKNVNQNVDKKVLLEQLDDLLCEISELNVSETKKSNTIEFPLKRIK